MARAAGTPGFTEGHLRALVLVGMFFAACCANPPAPRSDSSRPAEAVLGEPPLCEASAAVRAPWDPGLVLVADNEIASQLFGLRLHGDVLVEQETVFLGEGMHPDDVEALTVLGDALILMGSHGRNKHCQRRPERERFEVATWDRVARRLSKVRLVDSGSQWSHPWRNTEECLQDLFTDPPPERAVELCQAIAAAEDAIDPEHCIPPLDVEAAATIPDQDGVARVWLGLRRPRLGSGAVLVRMTAGLDEMRWDGVALLDVGDRGVRALTMHAGSLWAVIGPVASADPRSWLWWAPGSAIQAGVVVEGEVVVEGLPPAAEGLVFEGDSAVLVTDGAEGEDAESPCEVPAGQVVVPLPPDLS